MSVVGRWRPSLSAALLLAALLPATVAAETVTVAVASTCAGTAARLAAAFEAATKHEARLLPGSSGKLYAQIVNGLPADVFLSADTERPRGLVDLGLAERGSLGPYAIGQLVIWSRDPDLEGRDCERGLRQPDSKKIAIANPRLAPYGAAARQYLERLSIWRQAQPNLVFGENIAQTLQFVATGNASIGLVALSQLRAGTVPAATCSTRVPAGMHSPIEQDAVLLSRAVDNEAARAFLRFLRGESARNLIERGGYLLPTQSRAGP